MTKLTGNTLIREPSITTIEIDKKLISELYDKAFKIGMYYGIGGYETEELEEQKKIVLDKFYGVVEQNLTPLNKNKKDCKCLETKHIREENCFPYGDNIEYDQCIICGTKHNFRCC